MKAKLTFHPKTFLTEFNFSFSQMSLETFHPKMPLGTLNPTAACDPSLSLSSPRGHPGKMQFKTGGNSSAFGLPRDTDRQLLDPVCSIFLSISVKLLFVVL
jgi:hypothetical protein